MKQLLILFTVILYSCGSGNSLPGPEEPDQVEGVLIDIKTIIAPETCTPNDLTSTKRLFRTESYNGESILGTHLRYRDGLLITHASDHTSAYEQYRYDESGLLVLILRGFNYDSIFYDENGRVKNRQRYDADGLPEWNYLYSYNSQGEMIAITTELENEPTLDETDSLTWEDGNIVHEAYYWNGNLVYEHDYTYDDAPNYQSNLHYWMDWPWMYFSRNNPLTRTTKEYGVQFNFFCFDCRWTYEYDSDGYPIYVTNSSTDVLVSLSYACDAED